MFEINDRAANYGDGIFTTMLVKDNAVALFERHIKRLIDDSNRLALDVDENSLRSAIAKEASHCTSGVLKLLVSSGVGGRGYNRNYESNPELFFSHHQVPPVYDKWQTDGVYMGVSEVALAQQPLLAGLKHLNRLEQVLIKQALSKTPFDDVVVCDYAGHVIEASAANLFWLKDGQWYTPSVEHAGVAGVMRSFLLDWFKGSQINVNICQEPASQLANVQAMFMCNGLMKIVPVASFSLNDSKYDFDVTMVNQVQSAIEPVFKDEYVAFG